MQFFRTFHIKDNLSLCCHLLLIFRWMFTKVQPILIVCYSHIWSILFFIFLRTTKFIYLTRLLYNLLCHHEFWSFRFFRVKSLLCTFISFFLIFNFLELIFIIILNVLSIHNVINNTLGFINHFRNLILTFRSFVIYLIVIFKNYKFFIAIIFVKSCKSLKNFTHRLNYIICHIKIRSSIKCSNFIWK